MDHCKDGATAEALEGLDASGAVDRESQVPDELDVSGVRITNRPPVLEPGHSGPPVDEFLEETVTDPPLPLEARDTGSPGPLLDDLLEDRGTVPPPLEARVTDSPKAPVDDMFEESVTDPPLAAAEPEDYEPIADPYALEETYEPDDTVTPVFVKDYEVREPVVTAPGIVVYRAIDSDDKRVLVVGLRRGATSEERDRFGSLFLHREITGIEPERVNDTATVLRRQFSGTLADIRLLDLRLPERVELFKRIAEIFARFHEQGIAVGPLAPEHIFFDEALQPFILGPGIAPYHRAYTPPETIRGHYVDPVSDVYTLGKLLCFLTTQETPKLERNDPARLDFLMDYPAGLSRIARKAIRRDPAPRYASLEDMLLDLNHYGRYEEVGLAHPDIVERNLGGLSDPPPRWYVEGEDTTVTSKIADITGISKLTEITGMSTSRSRNSFISRMEARQARRRFLSVVVLAVGISMLSYNAAPSGTKLEPLQKADVAEMSGQLKEIMVSKDPPMFFAQVGPGWYNLSEEERVAEADAILAKARTRFGAPDGFLRLGNAVVVQYWGGNVIMFPPGER